MLFAVVSLRMLSRDQDLAVHLIKEGCSYQKTHISFVFVVVLFFIPLLFFFLVTDNILTVDF